MVNALLIWNTYRGDVDKDDHLSYTSEMFLLRNVKAGNRGYEIGPNLCHTVRQTFHYRLNIL